MPTSDTDRPKDLKVGPRVTFAALQILKERGGELPGRVVIEEIGKRLKFGEWERDPYESTGKIRW